MKKQIWSILLLLCIALCFMPMPVVYASDFTGWTKLTDEYSGKSLESGNYYLDSDVTLSDTITIKENKTVTIDLNGHVLQKSGGTLFDLHSGSRVIYGDDISYISGVKLTIQDSNPNSGHDDSSIPVGGAICGAEIDASTAAYDQTAVSINMTGGSFGKGASLNLERHASFMISGTARFTNDTSLTNKGKIYANGGRLDCEVSNRGTICNTATSITSFYGEIKNIGTASIKAVVSGGIYYGALQDGMTVGKTVTYRNGDAVFAIQVLPSGGRAASLEAPGNTGNVFTGWRKADGTGFDFSTAITDDLTLNAGWLDPASVGEKGDKGDTGTAGTNGKDGEKGDTGTSGTNGKNGADGIGIAQIKIDENGELLISLTNGTTLNLGKVTGDDAKDGQDGLTPYIGENGHWWIGEKDTGVQAEASGNTGNSPVIIIIGAVAGLALLWCIVLSVVLYHALKKKADFIE